MPTDGLSRAFVESKKIHQESPGSRNLGTDNMHRY